MGFEPTISCLWGKRDWPLLYPAILVINNSLVYRILFARLTGEIKLKTRVITLSLITFLKLRSPRQDSNPRSADLESAVLSRSTTGRKWDWIDLNYRFPAYQTSVLTNWTTIPKGGRWESNPHSSDPQSDVSTNLYYSHSGKCWCRTNSCGFSVRCFYRVSLLPKKL